MYNTIEHKKRRCSFFLFSSWLPIIIVIILTDEHPSPPGMCSLISLLLFLFSPTLSLSLFLSSYLTSRYRVVDPEHIRISSDTWTLMDVCLQPREVIQAKGRNRDIPQWSSRRRSDRSLTPLIGCHPGNDGKKNRGIRYAGVVWIGINDTSHSTRPVGTMKWWSQWLMCRIYGLSVGCWWLLGGSSSYCSSTVVIVIVIVTIRAGVEWHTFFMCLGFFLASPWA